MIHVASRFKRSFKKIPALIKEDFAKKIGIFRKSPFNAIIRTHKLHGNLDSYYAFCLRDGYRILFEFESDNEVLLINIGDHNDYSRWSKK